jgi:hypothetical protein
MVNLSGSPTRATLSREYCCNHKHMSSITIENVEPVLFANSNEGTNALVANKVVIIRNLS